MNTKQIKKIVCFGDSITDCGRRNTERPLGNGYVKIFSELHLMHKPECELTIINKGIGGNTIIDLQNRLTDDVIRQQPDLVTFLVGINDLHRRFRDKTAEGFIDINKFETTYDEVLTRLTAALPQCKLLLMSPFYMSIEASPNSFRHSVLDLLPEYISITQQMAKKYDAAYIDLQEKFTAILKYREADELCQEPVHPAHAGHLLIADALYNTIDKSGFNTSNY
jgi:lysophospholipase L1-like esterase